MRLYEYVPPPPPLCNETGHCIRCNFCIPHWSLLITNTNLLFLIQICISTQMAIPEISWTKLVYIPVSSSSIGQCCYKAVHTAHSQQLCSVEDHIGKWLSLLFQGISPAFAWRDRGKPHNLSFRTIVPFPQFEPAAFKWEWSTLLLNWTRWRVSYFKGILLWRLRNGTNISGYPVPDRDPNKVRRVADDLFVLSNSLITATF